MEKLGNGEVNPAKALELYKVAETLLAEKTKKATAVNKKDPNPVYCAGMCIKNCENRTGYIDDLSEVDFERCPQ